MPFISMNKKNSHKNYKSNSGFSLIEILVAMGVIAILASMSIYGFQVMNRNSRNSQRTKLANDVKLGMEEFYIRNGSYPNSDDLIYDNKTIKICYDGGENGNCESAKYYEIKVQAGILEPSSDTESHNDSTAFCYSKGTSRSNYVLGVKLEGKDEWKDIGNDPIGCTDTAIIWSNSIVFIDDEIEPLPTATPKSKPKTTAVPKVTKKIEPTIKYEPTSTPNIVFKRPPISSTPRFTTSPKEETWEKYDKKGGDEDIHVYTK